MPSYVDLKVRVPRDEADILDKLAQERGVSRSEACRLALRAGAPLVKRNFSVNVTRIVEVLEGIGAGVSMILMRDHPDYADTVDEVAQSRLERFHA